MRTLLTSILLASACAAPVFLATAQPAQAPTSAPSDAEIKLAQQKFLADLKTKADRGDQEAAAWYLYSTMVFAPNLDESRVEKAKLQALADKGNPDAQEILKHHEIRKIAALPNSTIDQKLAGARSAGVLQDQSTAYSLLEMVGSDQNVSAAQLIVAAELLRDWSDYANAIKVLEHPVAKKSPAAIGFEGQLMMEDKDPNNSELAEIFIRRAAAAGDEKSIAAVTAIDAKNSAKAEALFAGSRAGSYAARLELAEAYFSGSVPGIPQDLEKAKELAEYAATAPAATKLYRSEFMLALIAEKQGNRKEAARHYSRVDTGYNLDIDLRRRAQYLQELVLRPLRETYRNELDTARYYIGLTNPDVQKDIVKAKKALAKAMEVDFDDGHSEAYFVTGKILELENDYWNAYENYVKSFQSGNGDSDEALSSIIRLEKTRKEYIVITTDWKSTQLKEARVSAGIPDYSDPAFHTARFASSSSSTSPVVSSTGVPKEVSAAIAAFNRELDQFQQRNNLAGELHNTASNEIGKINESEWGTQTAAGSRVCNMFKTAIALRKTSIYYLNRAYNEAERIPSRFPQRAEALKEYEVGKSDIETADGITNKFGNQMGCWSGDYTGNGDPFYRNGL